MLIPRHRATSEWRLNHLIDRMKSTGWEGRPLLAIETYDGTQLLTGSHRYAAATALDIEIPIHLIEIPEGHITDESGDCAICGATCVYDFSDCNDDEELLEQITTIGDEEAMRLIQEECNGNFSEPLEPWMKSQLDNPRKGRK